MEELNKQVDNKPERNEKGQLLPGNTANPYGRPKGKTIKEEILEFLENHPDKKEEFIEVLIERYKPLVWQMLEGKPPQDLNLGSKEDLPFLIKFIKKEDERKDS